MLGDFNEIIFSSMMQSKRYRNNSQMNGFRSAIRDCNLSDFGFKGNAFTFSNRTKGSEETKVRLDRVLANKKWRMLFPKLEVFITDIPTSNHSASLLSF